MIEKIVFKMDYNYFGATIYCVLFKSVYFCQLLRKLFDIPNNCLELKLPLII